MQQPRRQLPCRLLQLTILFCQVRLGSTQLLPQLCRRQLLWWVKNASAKPAMTQEGEPPMHEILRCTV